MALLDPALLGDDVELDAAGNVTAGSGLKLDLYNAVPPLPWEQPIPVFGATSPAPYSAARPVAQADIDRVRAENARGRVLFAYLVNAWVEPLMKHVKDNLDAYVRIEGDPTRSGGGTDGLQTSTNNGDPTIAPLADVDLPVVVP